MKNVLLFSDIKSMTMPESTDFLSVTSFLMVKKLTNIESTYESRELILNILLFV